VNSSASFGFRLLSRSATRAPRKNKSPRMGTMRFPYLGHHGMSAFGPKRTWAVALQMSAFGGKADMAHCSANVHL
jgi:hypothetical protein